MKAIKTLLFSLLLISFISCSDTFKDHQKVKDMQWYRTDVKSFDVKIPEDGNYDLFFTMRHSSGYPFRNIGVKIEQITPEGIKSSKDADFSVVNEEGKYKGDVIGQLWDIEELLSEKTPLKKGKYTFKISHIMTNDPVILVIDIGLIVKESK